MKARYSLLFVLLLLPALLGAKQSTQSTSDSTRVIHPTKINSKYPGQSSASAIPNAGALMINPATNLPYPPCPGDPSNTNWPTKPLCPDLNGNPNPGVPQIVNLPKTSSYLQMMNKTQYFSVADYYCPDLCVTTRYSTPTAPTTTITSPLPVDNFQIASCPAGYAEVTDFNMQPAIAYVQIEQKVYGPFTSMYDFNAYKNNSAFQCSIQVNSVDPTDNIPINPVMYSPSSSGKYSYDKTRATNYADGYNSQCGHDASAMKIASDTTPEYTIDAVIVDPKNASNNVGHWVAPWTWSPFYENPTSDTNVADWDSRTSFLAGDLACNGGTSGGGGTPTITAGVIHNDIYWHYYRWERCRPIKTSGWFYVNSYEPASHLCSHVKPGWQDSNP